MNTFAQHLKLLRIKHKALQKDIATLLNITIRQYQRYEKGDQEPNIDSLIALADYFDVSIDYLVGRTDKPEMNK